MHFPNLPSKRQLTPGRKVLGTASRQKNEESFTSLSVNPG